MLDQWRALRCRGGASGDEGSADLRQPTVVGAGIERVGIGGGRLRDEREDESGEQRK